MRCSGAAYAASLPLPNDVIAGFHRHQHGNGSRSGGFDDGYAQSDARSIGGTLFFRHQYPWIDSRPTGIALFTDYVFDDDAMLRYSIASVSVLAGLFATGFLIYNLRHYAASFVESKTWTEEGA